MARGANVDAVFRWRAYFSNTDIVVEKLTLEIVHSEDRNLEGEVSASVFLFRESLAAFGFLVLESAGALANWPHSSNIQRTDPALPLFKWVNNERLCLRLEGT